MIFSCLNLAVPIDIMQHVVQVESSGNPYAIGVVGARLQRQPKNLTEAVATAKMLEQRGYNFSLGISQINRHNLSKYGLTSYEHAFQVCPNLHAGSRILKECFDRSKDWGKSFSCYYSGNFITGFRHGYVQKIFDSMRKGTFTTPYIYTQPQTTPAIAVQHHPSYQQAQPYKHKNTATGATVRKVNDGTTLPFQRRVDNPAVITTNNDDATNSTSNTSNDGPRNLAHQINSGQISSEAKVASSSPQANVDNAFVF